MPSEIERLIRELRLARRQAESVGENPETGGGNAKRFGWIIGVIGGLVSLLYTSLMFFSSVWKAPQTAVHQGGEIALSHESSQENKVKLRFNVTFVNGGSQDDVIQDASGSLRVGAGTKMLDDLVPISASGVACRDRDSDKLVYFPFSIGSSKSRDLSCEVTTIMPTSLTPENKSPRLFTLNFIGLDRRWLTSLYRKRLGPILYCWDRLGDGSFLRREPPPERNFSGCTDSALKP
jgi:hypothetical protein